MKKSYVFLVSTIVLAIVMACYHVSYEKYRATWWGINIYFFATIGGALIALFLYKLNIWLRNLLSYDWDNGIGFVPKTWFFFVVALGMCLSIYLGIRFTEPTDEWKVSNKGYSYNDGYHGSTFYNYYYYNFGGGTSGYSSSNSSSSSSSSSSDAAEGMAMVLIVLIVLAILALSATVTHFWVVGSIAILMMLAKFTYDAFEAGE